MLFRSAADGLQLWPEVFEEEAWSPIPSLSLLLGKRSPPLQLTFSHPTGSSHGRKGPEGICLCIPRPHPEGLWLRPQGVSSKEPVALLSPVAGNAAGLLWEPRVCAWLWGQLETFQSPGATWGRQAQATGAGGI